MKIGTIGTGGIVEWMMAEALRTDGMEWGAVCSRREATGRALADRFGVPRVYTDLDAMLADGELDFIYVASPNSLHYAQARRALLAGKNVICEKPFAPTRAQAEELAARRCKSAPCRDDPHPQARKTSCVSRTPPP